MFDRTDISKQTNIPVSVVMATYNGAKYLAQQIQSLLDQTVVPNEIIICDDASTDHTLAIIKQFSSHPQIKYNVNGTRLGVVRNFKKAVSLATPGHYIALCDQDDIWLPEKIEKSIHALSIIDDGHTPAMIYSDLVLISSNEEVLNPSVDNELGHDKYKHCLQTLLFGNFVLGCTVMMNMQMRERFSDIPENKSFNHDAWITLIAFSFGKVSSLNRPYIKYRSHDNNVTFTNHRKKNRIARIQNHLFSLFAKTDFLEEEIILVQTFYNQYQDRLSTGEKKMLQNFINLSKRSYLQKKIAFEIAFKNNWIKRF
ncbi:MAG: glycosyltransferase family 2 protein [Sediminibacterium sp.]|nr:glycosyltransferase family 2 protein [Sediminibacterium sp.]